MKPLQASQLRLVHQLKAIVLVAVVFIALSPPSAQALPLGTAGRHYVAMGDSYSSGEGNPPFQRGTNRAGALENRCHRSDRAYPELLTAQRRLKLELTGFVACSGATTNGVLFGGRGKGSWNEPAQVAALGDDTAVVTITIGANDVGLKRYIRSCLTRGCSPSSVAHRRIERVIQDAGFKEDLTTVYGQILDLAPNAQVYVVDYPYLTEKGSTPGRCLFNRVSDIRGLQEMMNQVIEQAVTSAAIRSGSKAGRLHLIRTNDTGSPFEKRGICQGRSSDFVMKLTPWQYALHPNVRGQRHLAQLVRAELSVTNR